MLQNAFRLIKKVKLSHDNLFSGVIVTQLLRDRFTTDRPRSEWRMQFLNEKAPLAALHITRHPMAVQGLKPPAEAGTHITDLGRMEAWVKLSAREWSWTAIGMTEHALRVGALTNWASQADGSTYKNNADVDTFDEHKKCKCIYT